MRPKVSFISTASHDGTSPCCSMRVAKAAHMCPSAFERKVTLGRRLQNTELRGIVQCRKEEGRGGTVVGVRPQPATQTGGGQPLQHGLEELLCPSLPP